LRAESADSPGELPQRLRLHPALEQIDLLVFDKDGTLLDFDAMWSGWVERLAADLSAAVARPVEAALFDAFGYDAEQRRALPERPLGTNTMAELRRLTGATLIELGVAPAAADRALAATWAGPDPVTLARPLDDLPTLFGGLRAAGRRIAVVTTDDREPTERTLEALEVAPMVEAVIGADDGLPVKPAPDAVVAVASRLGVAVTRTAVVGDTVADLAMARAAGALAIGVASGVGSAADLGAAADLVLPSVASLLA
jgi:phosphoglycolate phosphatase-like HAD superfamily hydrolase